MAAFGKGVFHAGGEHAVVEPVVNTVTWWISGGVHFSVGTTVDGLTVMMMFVVTLISLLVQIYSTAYMHDDRRYTWFFACLSLFTASMLTLVVSENLLQLLVGWELVGLCSFMLIGHWWEDLANSRAAIKAFLTTRVGDIGLMIGVIVMYFAADTFSIVGINQYALSSGAEHNLLARRRDLPVHRHHRQERPVPAAHLAARRHGRSHAGVGADPRGHDGGRRRVPRRPRCTPCSTRASRSPTAASTSWR